MENIQDRTLISEPKKRTRRLRKILNAALVTLFVQSMFIFLKEGKVMISLQINDLIETIFTFLYFLGLFWIYPIISEKIHSSNFNNSHPVYRNIVEAFAIVTGTFILKIVTQLFPLWLILTGVNTFTEQTWKFDPVGLRHAIIISAILGLFLYYFVERERILKRLRKEHLLHARLQREEFKNELEQLKNKVNPQFLFDNLETLEELIMHDRKEANGFVRNLSFIYRSFLNRDESLSALEHEVRVAEAYLSIINTRYRNMFNSSMDIPVVLKSYPIPTGSLRLLLESIIESNPLNIPLNLEIRGDGDCLKVKAFRTDKNVPIVVPDIKKLQKKYSYFTQDTINIHPLESEMVARLPLLKSESKPNRD